MNLCVIPARGGSKRIPNKNVKIFCGKPIIVWSIELAIASKCFDKIIVSTDNKEIADLAVFLSSNKAGYITGRVHVVDGGLTKSH